MKTLAEFKDEFYGKSGTEKRDKLEKGLTQEELAVKGFWVYEFLSGKVSKYQSSRVSKYQSGRVVEYRLSTQLET